MAHIRRFTRHIRTGDNHDFILSVVEVRIVRHEQIAFQNAFHQRMAAVLDVDYAAAHQLRTDIVVFRPRLRQAYKHVQNRYFMRRILNGADFFL